MKMWKVYNDFEDIDAKDENDRQSTNFHQERFYWTTHHPLSSEANFKVLIEEEGKDDPTKKVSAPIFNACIMSIF